MTRTSLFLLLLLIPACADTQLGRALTPRPAAAYEATATTPNQAGERSRDLASSLDQSLEAQEEADHADQQLVSATPETTHPVRVHHGNESDPVAAQR
jgi:hypothetical protein